MPEYTFFENLSTTEDIFKHLLICDESFKPPLSETIELGQYAQKLFEHATRLEFWTDNDLVALSAFYLKKELKSAFITNFSVIPLYTGTGLAQKLMNYTLEYLSNADITTIELEVKKINKRATGFYFKNNFEKKTEGNQSLLLRKTLL
ncbi:GNAT family N-acetyltransferase [Reichenbachiella sp.]|uniref:GNAT family N-acetyltransferase n=1 Tax=Reichenbachiella sp. TaxID=2184521 RepID=UPI003BB13EBC